MTNFFKIDKNLKTLAENIELKIKPQFKQIDEIALFNESKVLKAFLDNKVSSNHFIETTGYGYGDTGKIVIDNVFKQIFKTESSLTRCSFVSGTHAISIALFSLLNPNDVLLSITGSPYDTINKIIGSKNQNTKIKTLTKYGVKFKQIELLKNGDFDLNTIKSALKNKVKLIYIQRSRGYSLRPAISIKKIQKLVNLVKHISAKTIILVDNCYGEFVEKKEPTEVGANLICGSLIKNPGGAIAQSGGYIAGDEKLIEQCANTLTAPGLGKEIGCNFNQNKNILMGIFLAPKIVSNALKLSIFARNLFSKLGLKVFPKINTQPTDIVSAIELKSKNALLCFCKGIQNNSPIDSFLTPTPWPMPGYDCDIIMAAGTFINGASIEISADAPIKPPYNVFLQGGITYNTGKICILNTAQQLINNKFLKLPN